MPRRLVGSKIMRRSSALFVLLWFISLSRSFAFSFTATAPTRDIHTRVHTCNLNHYHRMPSTVTLSSLSPLCQGNHRSRTLPRSRTELNLLWFGSDDKKKEDDTKKDTKNKNKNKNKPKQKQSKMGSTAKTMENFKQSQDLGKKTSSLLQELSNINIEGVGAKGKIKVTVDGQQRPTLVDIDEDYFEAVTVDDFTEALTAAMMDAHDKSTKIMEEKTNGLYADLGLPSTKN